jgi:hypothetical protein
MLSPHWAVQVELAPRSPVQVKPISKTQPEEQPIFFPLSHSSPAYLIPLLQKEDFSKVQV